MEHVTAVPPKAEFNEKSRRVDENKKRTNKTGTSEVGAIPKAQVSPSY